MDNPLLHLLLARAILFLAGVWMLVAAYRVSAGWLAAMLAALGFLGLARLGLDSAGHALAFAFPAAVTICFVALHAEGRKPFVLYIVGVFAVLMSLWQLDLMPPEERRRLAFPWAASGVSPVHAALSAYAVDSAGTEERARPSPGTSATTSSMRAPALSTPGPPALVLRTPVTATALTVETPAAPRGAAARRTSTPALSIGLEAFRSGKGGTRRTGSSPEDGAGGAAPTRTPQVLYP